MLTVRVVVVDKDADIICKLPDQFGEGEHTYLIRKRNASDKKIMENELWSCRVLDIEKDEEGYYHYLLPDKKM